MYPPVTPLLALKRKARDATVLGGYRIPAGANVFLNVMALHHDPVNFPDPEVLLGLKPPTAPTESFWLYTAGAAMLRIVVMIGEAFMMRLRENPLPPF